MVQCFQQLSNRVLSGQSLASGVSGCLLLHQWGLFLMDSTSLVTVFMQVQCERTYYTNTGQQGRCLEFIGKFLKFQVVVALHKCNHINLKHYFLWQKFTCSRLLWHGNWDVVIDILEEHNHRSWPFMSVARCLSLCLAHIMNKCFKIEYCNVESEESVMLVD